MHLHIDSWKVVTHKLFCIHFSFSKTNCYGNWFYLAVASARNHSHQNWHCDNRGSVSRTFCDTSARSICTVLRKSIKLVLSEMIKFGLFRGIETDNKKQSAIKCIIIRLSKTIWCEHFKSILMAVMKRVAVKINHANVCTPSRPRRMCILNAAYFFCVCGQCKTGDSKWYLCYASIQTPSSQRH